MFAEEHGADLRRQLPSGRAGNAGVQGGAVGRMLRLGARSDADSEEEPASVRSLQENLSLVYGAVLGRRSQGWTTRADGFARREEMWGVRDPERCHFLS